jgi:hypothetical protein
MLTFAPAVYFVSVAEIVLSGEIWMFARVCQEFCVNRFNKQHRIAA